MTRPTVADLEADRTVYDAGHSVGRSAVVHTDPDCRQLNGARNRTDHLARHYNDDRPVCKVCEGEIAEASADNSMSNALKFADPEDLGLSPTGERREA